MIKVKEHYAAIDKAREMHDHFEDEVDSMQAMLNDTIDALQHNSELQCRVNDVQNALTELMNERDGLQETLDEC